MSPEIEEKRRATEVFVEWMIKKGYKKILAPADLAEIVALEQTKVINHKNAVFLMKYKMVEMYCKDQNFDLAAVQEKLFPNEIP